MPIKTNTAAAKPAAKPAAKAATPAKTETKEMVATAMTTILENGTVKGEPVTSEEREIKVFTGPTATVGVKLGYNRNLGNMEMAKVEAFISSPCYPEEVEAMFGQVLDKAKGMLEAALAEMPEGHAVGNADLDPTVLEGEADGAASAEDGGITIDYLKEADESVLTQIATENPQLEVNPTDYPEVDDLRETLIAVLLPDELEAYQAERAAAGNGDGTAEGEAEPYTEEQLLADEVTMDDLKQIFEAWGMGKYPPGPHAVSKKAAVKKILAKQAEGA